MSDRSLREDRPLLVAHRGASAVAPENTLVAFEAAIAAGADSVEFDVRMTADGAAVVMHDPEVDRTTDGSGPVCDLTLAELRRFAIPVPGGEAARVPTLDEALRCCSGRVAIDVEIKNLPGEPDFQPDRQDAVEATVRAIESGFSGPAMISSFNPLALAHSRSVAPGIPTGLLTDTGVEARAALQFAGAEGHRWVLPFVDRVLDAPGLAEEVHEAGLRLGVWITDDPAAAVRLWRLGADAVATNDPAPVARARAEAFG